MQAVSSVAPLTARFAFPLPAHWLFMHGLRAWAGLAAGACCTVVLWSFWSQWGTSLAVNCGLTIAAAAGLIAGLRLAQFRPLTAGRSALAWLALGAAVAVSPWISALTLGVLHWIPIAALEHPMVAVAVSCAAALASVGPAFALLCVVCANRPHGTQLRSRVADPWLWFGAACSLATIPVTAAQFVGMQQLGWILAAGAAGMSIVEWRRGRSGASGPHAAVHSLERAERRHPWDLTDLTHVVTGVAIGISCALTLHMNSQLQAGMAFTVFAALAGVLAGASLGLALRVWRLRGRPMEAENVLGSGMLLSVAGVAVLAAAFGLLIDLHLWLNATVSNHWVLITARVFLAGLPMLPCGLAMIVATDERAHMVRGHFLSDLSVVAASLGVGFAVFGWWAPEPAVVLPWFELAACGLAVVFVRIAGLSAPIGRRTYVAALGAIALAAAGFWFTEYDPARAARLLYSTTTFSAYRNGVEENTLMVLDDGRLAALRSNGQSTWTVWKHHGAQLQFRENGIPRHITSTNLAICPQSSGELLPAVAPLVLHPNPRRVLLTGLGSTATLQTCLAFPVTSLTCTEADSALVRLARKTVAAELAHDPLDDTRLQLLCVDPALAASAREEPYDVIIVAGTQLSLFDAAGTTTSDYYERLARKLRPGGVVCIRFQYVDFGAEPLRTMLRTVGSVFSTVRTLETAPGELVILASGDDGPRVDAEFAKRAEAPHVRRVMSQCGWDWSVLLGLAAIDDAAADAIAADMLPNTSANGRFTFTAAPEALRWGAKLSEIQQLLAAQTSQMLNWIGPCTEAEDIAKRLADVTEQRKVVHDNPEQFWSYRKTLKDRLQNRPRSHIVPVAHEGLQRRLHPEDERRKEYLKALGAAGRQAHPKTEAIQRVAGYVDPYDPLVSYFAHHEAAYLWSRSAERDPSAELGHRLYTVYYGAGTDRSVRNVTAALDLLLKSEDAADSPQARWDHMNSLLEVLRQRWAYRMQFPEQSRFAAADLDESLTVVRGTLSAMDEMHPELSMSRNHWRERRALLEKELLAPLKTAQVAQASRGTVTR